MFDGEDSDLPTNLKPELPPTHWYRVKRVNDLPDVLLEAHSTVISKSGSVSFNLLGVIKLNGNWGVYHRTIRSFNMDQWDDVEEVKNLDAIPIPAGSRPN